MTETKRKLGDPMPHTTKGPEIVWPKNRISHGKPDETPDYSRERIDHGQPGDNHD